LKEDENISPVDLTDMSPDNLNINNNDQSNMLTEDSSCLQQPNSGSTDCTNDLDQLNEKKDATDEDVLHNLDKIEHAILDSSDIETKQNTQSQEKDTSPNSEDDKSKETYEIDNNSNIDQNTSCKDNVHINENSNEILKTVKAEVNDWYEKKLAEKEAIILERLSKMARVLGISYPCYEKWLEWEEKVNGTPLCKLKPARHCCLKKPYTNRWKFICSKKKVQEAAEKINDADTSHITNTGAVWKLEPSGAWGVNINNENELPPFVLHSVKKEEINCSRNYRRAVEVGPVLRYPVLDVARDKFEEFLDYVDVKLVRFPVPLSLKIKWGVLDDLSLLESDNDMIRWPLLGGVKKETNNECKQDWLWLVVRCNSMDELMLFATGKNITRATMDCLKQVYESGPGKDCNVKSLYCKSTNKCDDTTVTDTTFLVGSEALDEIVGGIKVQLAPKTNFWSNTAGAENVANTVMNLLALGPHTTVLEIGCGIGLIGLMMASRCQQVIGVDLPSEVEEAEMTCELNNIKNASFIMGSPTEVVKKIIPAVRKRRTCAILNANTNIGRAIEIMTCLRKIPSLKRIVMITTLTKQSVRAILELARPVKGNGHGSPFVPILACVVDTLPIGPHFEAVILLKRRMMYKLNPIWFKKNLEENAKTLEAKKIKEKTNEQSTNEATKKISPKEIELRTKKDLNKPSTKYPMKKSKVPVKKPIHVRNIENTTVKNKFKVKRSHSPDRGEATPKKLIKRFGKFSAKPWQTDLPTKKKREWNTESSQMRLNPLYEKKLRDHKEQADLRERLSNNRLDTDIAQTVKEHQALLEIAKEKLSGPAPTVDVNTAKQLQNMLNMVLEQTNKLQSQLPRSVWDRIAPLENTSGQKEDKPEDPLLEGRYVQEMGTQDILITTKNQFSDNEVSKTKPFYKKYQNIPPLEPNTIMPVGPSNEYRISNPFRTSPERYETNIRQQQIQENSWNRDKQFERNRWNEIGNMRKPNSPVRRQMSPMKHRLTSPNRFSPKRPLLSPPRRPCSPPRRHFSPIRRPSSPLYRQRSPLRRPVSPPLRRPVSPPRRLSPQRRPLSPKRMSSPRRLEVIINRPMSPLRRQMSPLRRQMSPLKADTSPSRRQVLLPRRQNIPQEKQQIPPMRRADSPHRFPFGRPASPPRRQQSPQRRQMSPQQRFADDWDIPSRGAIEQSTWIRPTEKLQFQNIWQSFKPSTSTNSWDQNSSNDIRRKNFNLEKWDAKDSTHDDTWNTGGNTWNSKQICSKPMVKESWSLNSDNRWSNMSNLPGTSNDNWNIRGKESFNVRKDSWLDNKKQGRWEAYNVKSSWKHSDKEELNDLPEDARDPWGDDGNNLGLKEGWLKFENTSASSTWVRESEQQGDTWLKSKDNWHNKGLSLGTKPQWQNNGNQNVGESRWVSQNDNNKKNPPNTWQSGKNIGSWQTPATNFQSQRSFSTTQFKSFH
ncbi:tRNA (uracil(54)-C(5))-methyltransferase like protein, partial [Dufourea novaeangliae]